MKGLDKLCAVCIKIDLFALFTGPRYFSGDGFEHRVAISMGTLAEINANINCPLCRLLHHEIYENCFFRDYWLMEENINHVDPSKIRVKVHPIRTDYHEETKYINSETRDLVATTLETRLHVLEGLSEAEIYLVQHHARGNGIQLLSPDCVDPARPLLNGHQATNSNNSLDLLQKWLKGCVESHTLQGGVCARPYYHKAASEYSIRVIDVEKGTLEERNPEETDYAALSYVREKHGSQDAGLQGQHELSLDAMNGSLTELPSKISKVVKDAILVCKKVSISYLWVDRYCIDQGDMIRKGSEIVGMGYRYLYAKITLVAGMDPEAGLLPRAESAQMQGLQKIETVQGRKYITALPSIGSQIRGSPWATRAWTMQEGQLAYRCAFFGEYDISFLCPSGHWRESLHSGPYGHGSELPDVDTDSKGHYFLSWIKWMNERSWKFHDYHSLLMSYTPRQLSFESDRLNAITGCFKLIAETKGVPFYHGVPATDFHYALLWTGEYDRRREGFPSWSWAGWHCLQQMHNIYPMENGTCALEDDGDGNLKTVGPVSRDVELQGLLISLTERPTRANKCLQRFADITYPSYKTNTLLIITSEVVHFSTDIVASSPEPEYKSRPPANLAVPHDFDSSSSNISWDDRAEYRTPYSRLRLRDDFGNVHTYHYPRWYDHWPPLKLNFPHTLRGETLAWLLKEGIELVMILELELLEGDESLKPFHLVLCLGVDRREDVAKRCGMFCLPKPIWEKACPKVETITMG